MFKWQIGDHVRVIDSSSFFYLEEGFVSQYNEDLFHNVFVRFPSRDNTKCNFRIKELEEVSK